MDMLQVRSYSLEGDLEVVAVEGEVDVFTAPRVKDAIDEIIGRGARQVAVNLQGVRYLDSTALSVLVTALRTLRARQGRLLLVSDSPRIQRVLDLTGLSKVFTICPDEETARRTAREQPAE